MYAATTEIYTHVHTLSLHDALPILSMNLGPSAGWGLELYHHHVTVNPATGETNHAGIVAIGDIARYHGKLKLILTGFSEAAIVAHAIDRKSTRLNSSH